MLEVDMVVSLHQHQQHSEMVLQELLVLAVAVVQEELILMVIKVVQA
tara:strand:- start:622 stop:762 length:141 start_codon:yes stop_codon:yes gene_type:complete